MAGDCARSDAVAPVVQPTSVGDALHFGEAAGRPDRGARVERCPERLPLAFFIASPSGLIHLAASRVTMPSDKSPLPPALRSVVDAQLQSGERVTWVGQPIPGHLALAALPSCLTGILVTAFAIFVTGMMVSASFENLSGLERYVALAFSLLGLLFVLVGFVAVSRPYREFRAAQGKAYVITNRRAMIVQSFARSEPEVTGFMPGEFRNLRLERHPGKSGDVIFSERVEEDDDGNKTVIPVGFISVRDAEAAFWVTKELIQTTRRQGIH